MDSLATVRGGPGLSRGFRDRAGTRPCTSLRLAPADDGWALLAQDGELVFRAPGARGRRRCLAFARAHGVLALFS
jgi:hypothetical protein